MKQTGLSASVHEILVDKWREGQKLIEDKVMSRAENDGEFNIMTSLFTWSVPTCSIICTVLGSTVYVWKYLGTFFYRFHTYTAISIQIWKKLIPEEVEIRIQK